jgi:hypothetical protein
VLVRVVCAGGVVTIPTFATTLVELIKRALDFVADESEHDEEKQAATEGVSESLYDIAFGCEGGEEAEGVVNAATVSGEDEAYESSFEESGHGGVLMKDELTDSKPLQADSEKELGLAKRLDGARGKT